MSQQDTINLNKNGTLIVSYYRSGGHFLHDYISDSVHNIKSLDEINDLSEILNAKDKEKYYVGILHKTHPKFFLMNNNILDDWHVVRLTRKNKIDHFISSYFWRLNVQRGIHQFEHHGTVYKIYKEFINDVARIEYDIEHIECWLLEQLLLDRVKCNVTLDYEDLKTLESDNIRWNANNYGDVSLSSLFTNHQEIENILNNFNP